MKKNITRVEALNLAIAALTDNTDAVEVLTTIRDSIAKANTRKSDKPTKNQQANMDIKSRLIAFMGDGNLGWEASESWYDRGLNYAGTWGIGLQLRDMSFIENIKHTFRVAYWGGTNSPSMVKYMAHPWSWNEGTLYDGPYLTTNDGILEFNLVNSWQLWRVRK